MPRPGFAEKQGYHVTGLAPSASAARTLESEAGIESETLQRFVARHAGIAEGRGTDKGVRNLRLTYEKTLLVVDESSLASTEQMRDLLKVATTLRTTRVVLVGDEKQLDGVEAGTPFAQLRTAGMQTTVMDEIVRQRDAELKEAVRGPCGRGQDGVRDAGRSRVRGDAGASRRRRCRAMAGTLSTRARGDRRDRPHPPGPCVPS